MDPIRDVETINLELIFADLETVEKRLERAKKMSKGGDKKYLAEIALFEKIKAALEAGNSANSIDYTDEERDILKEVSLLTLKPVIFAANVSEDEVGGEYENNENYQKLKEYAQRQHCEIIPISAKIEEEIAQLDDDEREVFLEELGLSENPDLTGLLKPATRILGLISYITSGTMETKAWTIVNGTKAPQAAGKIHTDFERGFIRAEVVSYDDLMACGTMHAAKEKGLVRSEGKDYVIKDGDIVLFRFNV